MDKVVRPAVGVAVIITKDDTVLLGKRKGAHGNGKWAFPGGHLEFKESIEDCARREVLEETGLTIGRVRHRDFTNDIFSKENKHYATLFVQADYVSGTAKVLEPEKCEKWEWFKWNKLPSPLFLSLENLVGQGFNPF